MGPHIVHALSTLDPLSSCREHRYDAPMPVFDVALLTFMGLFGLLSGGFSLWAIRRTRVLLGTGERVLGRPARAHDGTADGASQYDVVEFTTRDGQRGQVSSRLGVKWSTQDLSIPVIYDPSDPKHAVIDQKVEVWGAPVLLLFIGAMSVLVPVGVVAFLYGLGELD